MIIDRILRKLPIFRGKQRLSKWLLKTEIESLKNIETEDKIGCKYLLPNIKENIGFEIFINAVYEPETIELIIELLQPNALFLDIGANIGAISLPICKCRPDVSAYSIEASPRVFEYLKINTHLNELSNCTVINKAISDIDNQELNFYSPVDNYGKGSFANVFTNDAERVTTITLDSLLSKYSIVNPDVIKIDIEGFEYVAFKGGVHALSKPDAPDIIFEFVDWAERLSKLCVAGGAQQQLLDYGYSLYEIKKSGKLKLRETVITKGAAMLLATKKNIGFGRIN